MADLERGKNNHYSEQTGHVLRGLHQDVMKKLKGTPPESIPGYMGLEGWRRRRTMRRINRDGR